MRIYRVSKIIPESDGAEHASEWQNGNGSPAPGRTHGGPTMFARISARAYRFVKCTIHTRIMAYSILWRVCDLASLSRTAPRRGPTGFFRMSG